MLSLVIFFGVHVPISLWWTHHFERGPIEALWALWARLTDGAGSLKPRTVAAPQ